jgi:hypothetical protein
LAVVQAGGFTALTEPWVHGALLVAFVVAGLGLFVVLCWLLARLLSPRRVAPPTRNAQTDGAALPAQLPSLDAREVAPKLARRARAAR